MKKLNNVYFKEKTYFYDLKKEINDKKYHLS